LNAFPNSGYGIGILTDVPPQSVKKLGNICGAVFSEKPIIEIKICRIPVPLVVTADVKNGFCANDD